MLLCSGIAYRAADQEDSCRAAALYQVLLHTYPCPTHRAPPTSASSCPTPCLASTARWRQPCTTGRAWRVWQGRAPAPSRVSCHGRSASKGAGWAPTRVPANAGAWHRRVSKHRPRVWQVWAAAWIDCRQLLSVQRATLHSQEAGRQHASHTNSTVLHSCPSTEEHDYHLLYSDRGSRVCMVASEPVTSAANDWVRAGPHACTCQAKEYAAVAELFHLPACHNINRQSQSPIEHFGPR